ncbi:MAG TPA: histidine kinase dimerization/phospho-acceptor domain-containing protein [Gemmatimonadaceae bacterium]|nr:histidine kinase dimerization/phospho-acceptor domain-containing protein [Gemmatimonadaceae bacterium]
MTNAASGSSSAREADGASAIQHVTAVAQHQLNNPLAALLVETQLLGLEPTLAPQHKEALDRITELVRRVIKLVRTLDEATERALRQ